MTKVHCIVTGAFRYETVFKVVSLFFSEQILGWFCIFYVQRES